MYFGKAYRYRGFGAFNRKSKARLKEMFIKSEIFMANPMTFNDPFECHPTITYNSKELREYLNKILKKRKIKIESKYISEQMQNYKNGQGLGIYKKAVNKNIGICCMSKSPEIITQWAYYAENGAGFCVEYEISETFPAPCLVVEYDKGRPEVDIVRFQCDVNYRNDILKTIIMRKSYEWSHEQELRIFHNKPGALNIPQKAITGVVFGPSIEPKKREYLEKVVEKSKLPISLYEINLNKTTYGLKKVKLF